MEHFDVIVIGAGSGGLNVASFMNKAGFKVLLIDKDEASIGGDCLNYGCVPSKALIHAARTAHETFNAQQFGLEMSGSIDLARVMQYVRHTQHVIREHENVDYFRDRGITIEIGEARFVGRKVVAVGDTQYTARKIVLATGSRPRSLEISGIEEAPVYTNETVFNLTELPKRLVVIGGGPIGCEIGQAFRYLGSEVTIVDRGNHILPKEDPEIAGILQSKMEEEGIRFVFEASIDGISGGNSVSVNTKGRAHHIPFDALFVSIGRELNTESVDLKAGGIETDENGRVIVDDKLRTTNKDVLACGDIAGGFQFTHMAEVHAGIIINNFFAPWPFKKELDTDSMWWVTYTTPEIATFGLQEAELKKRKMSYEVISETFSENDRAITDNYRYGLLKVFISERGGVLGGTMIAPHAGELVQELVLAQHNGLTLEAFFEKIYAYPTAGRINKQIAAKFKARSLTDMNKKFLRFLFR